MTTFAIEFESAGLCVEVRLNGVRVYRETSGVPRIREDRVNHWMVPGENVLELWLGLPEAGSDDTTFEAEWLRWQENETRGAAERIATYRWNHELALARGELRRAFDARVSLENAFGAWAWQGADGGALTLGDRSAIVEVLWDLHGAVARGDVVAVRRRLALQNDEMARAHGQEAGDRDRRQHAFLTSCVTAPRWRLEPLDPATLLFAPHADGKLVSVSDRHGLPPVRGTASSVTFDLPSVFSKIGGAWTVVR
jgi:hypothetical protein